MRLQRLIIVSTMTGKGMQEERRGGGHVKGTDYDNVIHMVTAAFRFQILKP